jgi:hypothetical protein
VGTRGRIATVVLLALGLAGIGAAALLGRSDLLEAIVTPPALVRAALVGAMVVLAVALLRAAVDRFRAAGADAGPLAEIDAIVMLRGIRLAFLALAAVAAGIGWLLGHPLPLVVAAVIAAVDLAETSLLLLVAGVRGGGDAGRVGSRSGSEPGP